jgi:hypothetical protein
MNKSKTILILVLLMLVSTTVASALPDSFDWRNKDGKN